ncbi:MAG: heavy metal translocating P-type ATPase [Lachnospiraceae bacterium]|nr:heavy metal translocating P-type ATPase [Lachnospiraceae bacterium]
MKCTILHESGNRIRFHACVPRMSFSEADKLEYFLKSLSYIKDAKVNHRSRDAVIFFCKNNRDDRPQLRHDLSHFNFANTEVSVPENTGRELNAYYEEKLITHVVNKGVRWLIMPAFIRPCMVMVRAVPFIVSGIKTLLRGELKVNVLDAISIGVSLARRDFSTAGGVMFLLKIGEIMEEWTHKKSVDDLARAMSLNIDKVWVIAENGEEVLESVTLVKPGDRIIVRTGNVIPLDGKVTGGEAHVNQASMTGESLPVHKREGAYAYAGTVVEDGEITIEVKEASGNGRYDRIVSMIEESEKLKSATEAKASLLADRLVPYSLGATFLTYLFTRNVTKAVSILMVDYCCALKLAMPISVLSAMREAGNHRISVKGGKFMEGVAEAETIVFDKTGTLTKAIPSVEEVVTFDSEDPDEMLRIAACLEEHYPHSIANSVVKAAADKDLKHEEMHSAVNYVVAHGIRSTIENKDVMIGSYHFIFEDNECIVAEEEKEKLYNLPEEYSHLYMSIDKKLKAVILIKDPLKDNVNEVIEKLREVGFKKIVMMTGDSEKTAAAVAKSAGIDEYMSEVLPEDKAAFVKAEHAAGRKVIMIGDGVNDSPALAEADVGIAISEGAPIAREIADINIASDDLMQLVVLKRLSEKLMERIKSNYRFIMGFNSTLIILGILGALPPTSSAFLHNASTIAIGINSMTNLEKE